MDVPVKKTAASAVAIVTAPAPPTRHGKQAAGDEKPTTLLDVHEVEWITRELDRLLAREEQQSGGGDGDSAGADGGRWHRRKRAKVSPAPTKKGGFVAEILGRHAVSICSGTASGVDRGQRRPRGRGRSFREVEKV